MRTAGFLSRRVGPRPDDGRDDAVQALLVGSLSAKWTYSNADVTFGPYRQGVRAAITETFAVHAARSVQHTLYAIADVVLATYEEILDITLSMHERPYRPADLFSAQLENPDELFVAAEEPLGVVEVTVERDSVATIREPRLPIDLELAETSAVDCITLVGRRHRWAARAARTALYESSYGRHTLCSTGSQEGERCCLLSRLSCWCCGCSGW